MTRLTNPRIPAAATIQPALAHSIQVLESQAGVPRFDRESGDVEPSDVGCLFLDWAGEHLAHAADLARKVDPCRGLGSGVPTVSWRNAGKDQSPR